jgi:hypothetical protein
MQYIIDQPFGIGDILFLSPIVSQIEADKLIWPVIDHYYWIHDYIKIPNLTFIKNSEFNKSDYQEFAYIPFRNAHGILPKSEDCMIAKYNILGAQLDYFYTGIKNIITRNTTKELELYNLLGIRDKESYIIINNNFAGPEYNYKLDINISTTDKIIYMDYINGFTLLDWMYVLENAKSIHTVSTSLFFVIESINTDNIELNLYPRKPLDTDLSPIKTLLNEKWICYE